MALKSSRKKNIGKPDEGKPHHGFFNVTNGELIFASPKVYGIISNPLQEYLQELQQLTTTLRTGHSVLVYLQRGV